MNLLEKYSYTPQNIDSKVADIKANTKKWCNKDVYTNALGLIDLTSLTISDTDTKIATMTKKVCDFHSHYPNLPLPASICVYPNFAHVIAKGRNNCNFNITVVGGCFPSSQSFIDVKVAECVQAVKNGADEVDIVLSHALFNEKRYAEAASEIKAIGDAIRAVNSKVHLKVILESGLLKSYEDIAIASFLAIEAGADFIKTSTGKTEPAATPEAAYIMCECIKKYFETTGKKIGFKPAGGVASAEDAALFYGIVDSVLGGDWLNKELFRFGASRMANNLLSEIVGDTVKYY